MPALNFFQCKLEDKLVIWQNMGMSGNEYHKLGQTHESIRFPDNKRKIAYPMHSGCEGILDSLGFKPVTVRTSDYLNAFSDLCKYGFITFLMDNGFQALHESPAKVEANQVSKLYESPIYKYPDSEPEFMIYEGMEVRRQGWNFQSMDPRGGISIRYITTPYFVKPLNVILQGTDFAPYVRMECPTICRERTCPFYYEGRLIGKFAGFADTGIHCRFSGTNNNFASLSDKRQDLQGNPPVERVNIEPDYVTISNWAEKKLGEREIRRKIGEARGEFIGGRINLNKAKHEYSKILELIARLPTEFEIPNGQVVSWEKNMLKIEVGV